MGEGAPLLDMGEISFGERQPAQRKLSGPGEIVSASLGEDAQLYVCIASCCCRGFTHLHRNSLASESAVELNAVPLCRKG